MGSECHHSEATPLQRLGFLWEGCLSGGASFRFESLLVKEKNFHHMVFIFDCFSFTKSKAFIQGVFSFSQPKKDELDLGRAIWSKRFGRLTWLLNNSVKC